MSICIVDFKVGGHHGFYLKCVIGLSAVSGFVGHREHLSIVRSCSNVKYITCVDEPQGSSSQRMAVLKRHVREHGKPEEFFLLEADQLDISVLAKQIFDLGATVCGIPISGIWFRSNFLYRNSVISGLKKYILLKLLSRWCDSGGRLFFLDDALATRVAELSGIARDEVWCFEPYSNRWKGARDKHSVVDGNGVTRLLFIGAQDERKGTSWALNAIADIGWKGQSRLVVHVAGSITDCAIYGAVERLRACHIQVLLDDSFLSEESYASAFDLADVVMLPYIGFGGSSGVLIEAAQYRRQVVASDSGTVGRLVRDSGMGCVFEVGDPLSFMNAIAGVASKEIVDESFSQVLSRCSLSGFRSMISAKC